jgi:cruciform cutting endonuclease 1
VLSTARILSIDLGLRNFAFSLLTPAHPPLPSPPPSQQQPSATTAPWIPVHVHAWHRLDLTSPALFTTITTNTTANIPAAAAATLQSDAAEDAREVAVEKDADADAFSPTAMASLTLHLVQTHLLPLNPTHILIERQRYRTGGGAAVYEWTLRVNTLEAMLHAVFAALGGEGRVYPVVPKAVTGFLFPPPSLGDATAAAAAPDGVVQGEGSESEGVMGMGMGKGRKSAAASYRLLKSGKVELLARWLAAVEGDGDGNREGLVIPQTEQAKEMARAFLGELRQEEARREKTGGKVKRTAVGKLDDLSDSVLQGMVWLQWQRNLEDMIKTRPELLGEER